MTIEENARHWASLERAKRRLLLELDDLGLPPNIAKLETTHPLKFQFLANTTGPDGTIVPVFTGHANGVITVNILEADSVYREQTRVALGEPKRTLIGHMRHEIGHYLDWCYASRVAKSEYDTLFGSPESIDYEAAKTHYYTHGPKPNWAQSFVSAYASMHPWEDFAETVNSYMDLTAIARTASDQKLAKIDYSPSASIPRLVAQVLQIAVTISEFNLDVGLPTLLPERLPSIVVEKLAFVHRLRSPELISGLQKLQSSATCTTQK